jgi:hypothetical protein
LELFDAADGFVKNYQPLHFWVKEEFTFDQKMKS